MPGDDKKNIVALSLDYDGCGSILFRENDNSAVANFNVHHYLKYVLKETQDVNLRNYVTQILDNILKNEKQLEYLEKKIQSYVEEIRLGFDRQIKEYCVGEENLLLVGSNRQDPATDAVNCYKNKTISCFDAYRSFAEKNHMRFCELLLGDIYDFEGRAHAHPKPVGDTMKRFRPGIAELSQKNNKEMIDFISAHVISPVHESKLLLIQSQIDYLSQHHEGQTIQYIFIDDRKDILDNLKTAKQNGKLQIPSNINVEFITFGYIPLLANKFHRTLNQASLQTELGKRSRSSSIEDSKANTPTFFRETKVSQSSTSLSQVDLPENASLG